VVDWGRVARSTVDRWWRGSKAPEHGDALTRAWPQATPEHGSSLTGAQQREGKSARASSGLGRRRGGRATERNGGDGRCSVGWELWTRERAKEGGGQCGDGRGCSSPFYSGRGGARWARKGEMTDGNGLNAIEGGAA
jgi:hypothetical protein